MKVGMRGGVVALTSGAAFIAGLDNLVVTFALPAIQRDFDLSVTALSWTVNAYTLTFAVFMLAAAAIGERIGRRTAFQIGLGIFTLSSVAVALAPGIEVLTAARAVQGIGAAILVPLSLTLLVQETPEEKRPIAIAFWSSAQGLATAIGPLVGGAIVQFAGWQWAFWINVPIGLVLILSASAVLRNATNAVGRFDLPGLLALSLGVFALVLALTMSEIPAAATALTVGIAAVGTLLIVWFIGHVRRTRHPVISPRLWRSRGFTLTNVTALLVTAGMFGVVFLLTQYLQRVLGYEPLQAGLMTLPWTLLPVVAAPIAGQLVAKLGTNVILTVGTLLQAAALASFALVIAPDVPYLLLLPGLLLAGLGMGAFFAVLATQALRFVRAADEGIASGINNFVRELGVLVGVAALAAVFVASGSQANAADFTRGLVTSLWVGTAILVLAVLASILTPRPSGARTESHAAKTDVDRPTRVLWVTTGWMPEIGGPSIGNLDRAKQLAQRTDIELVVLAPQHPGAVEDTTEHGFPVRRYESKPWAPYPEFRVPTFGARRWLERQVVDVAPDVIVNTDLERGYLFSTWRLPGRTWALKHEVPYVAYYHTDFYGFAASYPVWRHLRGFTLRPLIARLYRAADVVIANSDSSTAQVVGFGVAPDDIARIPFDGVDVEAFAPTHARPEILEELTGVGGRSTRTVLSIGRIAAEKRIDLTIRATAEVMADPAYSDLRLIVAGEGPGTVLEDLKRLAGQMIPEQRVDFIPFVHGQRKAELLATVDVFSLPSTHETFSITTTEVMASGTPVVCADSGAPPTYITDGVNGFLCEPDSVAALADGLRRALECDRDLIGRDARATVRERFSMDVIGERFSALLLNLARDPHSSSPIATKGPTS